MRNSGTMPELNWMMKKLYPHVGHEIECVTYGDQDAPHDVCVECITCGCVLVSGEDFEEEEMTNTERKLRLDFAIEVAEGVFSDLCRESTAQVGREQTSELANILVRLRAFSAKLEHEEAAL